MSISTDSRAEHYPEFTPSEPSVIEHITARPVRRRHPAEAGVLTRHEGIPGHDQQAAADANIVLVGAGGLNSWTGLALVRSGTAANGIMTILDDDVVEPSNLARQLFQETDLGHNKAHCLARNLASHAVAGGQFVGIPQRFEDAAAGLLLPGDVLVVGVDNNACRVFAVRYARQRQMWAVFSMLSADGMRCNTFLQSPYPGDACLWCALPNLDPEREAACVPAIVSSCLLAGAYAAFFVHRALMGWPVGVEMFNWREADLLGVAPDRVGYVERRPDCPMCGRRD